MTAGAPPSLRRLPDWPERLAEHLAAQIGRPFAWGVCDCVTVAADAVLATTGDDPLDGLRGTWASAKGAAVALHRLGGMEAAVDSHFPRLPNPLMAQRGDIVLVHRIGERRHWLGVVTADGWVAPGAAGPVRGLISEATAAWSVGRSAEGGGNG